MSSYPTILVLVPLNTLKMVCLIVHPNNYEFGIKVLSLFLKGSGTASTCKVENQDGSREISSRPLLHKRLLKICENPEPDSLLGQEIYYNPAIGQTGLNDLISGIIYTVKKEHEHGY